MKRPLLSWTANCIAVILLIIQIGFSVTVARALPVYPTVHPVYAAFMAADAKPASLAMNAWSVREGRYFSDQEKQEFVQAATAEFGIVTENLQRTGRSEKNLESVQYEAALGRDAALMIIIQNANPGPHDLQPGPQTLVMITVSGEHDYDAGEIREWRERLGRVFSRTGLETHWSVQMIGTRRGKIALGAKKTLMQKMLTAVGAEPQTDITTIDTSDLVSVNGYTPAIKDNLSLNGRQINIHLAIRYHPAEKLTYFYIGSPLIFSDY